MSREDDRSKGLWRSLFGRRSAVYWSPLESTMAERGVGLTLGFEEAAVYM